MARKKLSKSPNQSNHRSLTIEQLEQKILLDATGFGTNDCPPSLDLDAVQAQAVAVGQTLAFNLFTAGGTLVDLDSSGVATGDNLRVILDPDVGTDTPVGASITVGGDFSWTPTTGQAGLHTITVIAIDSGNPALSDAETFLINVTDGSNQAAEVDLNGPASGSDSSATFIEDGGAVVVVASNLTLADADGTTLASATATITNLQESGVESLSVNTSGTSITASYETTTGILSLTGTDSIANYQQVLRTLSYNNTSQDPTTTARNIEVTVNDGTSNSTPRISTVTIVAVNDSPNLAVIANQDATIGEEMVVTVSATDPESGDTLTFELDPNGFPPGAQIQNNGDRTATIRWTPQTSDLPGPINFVVIVTDDGNLPLADSESFTVTLTSGNASPDLAAITDQTATVGTQVVFNVTATDADSGDTLTFALDKDNNATPSDAIIQQTSNTTATVRWTPVLADFGSPVPFRVLVTDNGVPAEGDSEDFLVTVSAASNSMILAEGASFNTTTTEAVALGQAEGTRTIAFDLETAFDRLDSSPAVEDLFQVFLVDANDPLQTLLDNGKPGTAVFSLAGDEAEYQPGLVRYDGSRVEIDITSLGSLTTANLVFQLINSDTDEGTKVAIGPIENFTDSEALATPILALRSVPVDPAGTTDLTGFSTTSQVGVKVQNVRFDASSGSYKAEVSVRNNGPAIGRQMAIAFPGLPNDVTFDNASGTDGNGDPYINMASAIGSGGLAAGASSRPVTIQLSNPNSSRFSLTPTILSGGANSAPTLGSIAPITAVPGDYITIQLDGQDVDEDTLTYSLASQDSLPGGMLMANGKLIFKPAPGQQGSYDFTVSVSDGVETVSQSSLITVETDSVTTTRFSGQILDTDETALAGVPIEIRAADGTVLLNTTTDANGDFFTESATAIVADTIVIRGEQIAGASTYPFIAEKLPLVLGHDVYDGAKNVIFRPIYLPVLDVAGGTTIDPTQNTTVDQEIAPGEMAQVFVQANSLKMDDGSGNMVDFTGTLSITEVPASLTPAALPNNLIPDTVVTIQPGEMVFSVDAQLTLPNRAGYAPGTVMDLWSINPETGDFDKVGQGQVTSDGQFIETISGGIRNSSWHLFTPPEPTPTPEEMLEPMKDPNCGCGGGGGLATETTNSEVELFTGALRETHDLVTYQSLGQTHGLQLFYNSLHADPQPIVPFGFDNIPANDDRFLIAELELMRGDFMYQLPGFEGGQGLDGGEHFWTLPQNGGNITAALQVDLASVPTGVYDYTLRSGLFRQTDSGDFTGTSANTEGQLYVTNRIDSAFGAGWSLAGQQSVVENPDGSIMLLDGGGTRFVFTPDPANTGQYLNPPADFSKLEKLPDNTFRRTTTNQTVYQFNDQNQLVTMTDRNSRVSEWQYDASGNLTKWIDQVGLETVLNYTGGKVSSIVDPAGRTTSFDYDTSGNLTKITDPDGSFRTFGYDVRHRMTSEIDQRGFLEQTVYGENGRVERALLKDGGERIVQAVQSAALFPASDTSNPLIAPVAPTIEEAVSLFADENGSTEETMLDRFGQRVSGRDAEGRLSSSVRDDNNLVTGTLDSRGFSTDFTYDEFGNVITITDRLGAATGGSLFVTGHDSDDHGNGEYQQAGLDFLTYGREATSDAEIAGRALVKAGFLGTGNGAQNGATTSGYTDRTFIDLDDINWEDVAFDGTFEILIIGTGSDFVSSSGSAKLNSEAEQFADFFNEGGGIYVNTDNGRFGQSFYEFLPTFGATQAAVGGTAVYTVTQEGLAIGLTEAAVDADPTHTEYQNVDTSIFRVFETHDVTGDAVAIGLFQGFIGDGTLGGVGSRFFTYDPDFAQATSFTDERGNETLFEIDPATGNRMSSRQVIGEVDDATNGETDDLITTFTYTTFALIDTTTDALGRTTDFDYDGFGRLTMVTFAVGTADEAFQTFEYDTAGNRTAVVDENSNRTEFVYDTLNRLTQITEPDPDAAGPLTAPVTSFTYDAFGNLDTTTDARGNVTTNEYDPMNRLDRTIDANDQATQFAYDEAGNLARVTDPLGFRTNNVYDARNRLIETADPEGGVTAFAYDTDDNLASVTDPVGNVTQFLYDARDRLVQEIDPLGEATFYKYDARDNLVQKTDRIGRITRFEYDDLDRLTTETWLTPNAADPDNPTVDHTILYTYDAVSNLSTVVDAFSSLAFTYDNRDRVQTVDNAGTPNTPVVVLDYGYDGVGNVTSVADTIDTVAGATTGYAYDALNRTTSVQQSGPSVSEKLVDFVYNELGQFDEIARYSDLGRNNLVALSDYEYDELNRLTDLDHTNAADAVLAFYDFEYDPSSRITKLTDIDGATDYSYDDRSQLTGADRDAADTRGDESYAYDENGNRTSSSLHGNGYVTGDGNRLLSDGTFDYEYDAEGNMTKRTEISTGDYREFGWDHRNRMVSVTDFSSGGIITQEVEFAYDTLDRRITKTVDADGAGAGGEVSTLFVYDREDVLLDFVDADGSGIIENPVLDLRYLHGPGIDQVLAQENGSVQWLLVDHLEAVRDLVSNTGVILNHLTYDSFGNVLSETDPLVSTRYLFTGREFDAETGLHYYRARYYDAGIGRFITLDPTRQTVNGTNYFAYVENSPIVFRDSTGLDKEKPGRSKGSRFRSSDDALQQIDEIGETQRKLRKFGRGEEINDITKSEQRAKNQLRNLRGRLRGLRGLSIVSDIIQVCQFAKDYDDAIKSGERFDIVFDPLNPFPRIEKYPQTFSPDII